MKLTNHFNLPKHLYKKILYDITNDVYPPQNDDAPFFRVTELIDAPLVRTLNLQYIKTDQLTVDAADFLPMLFGSAVHEMLKGTSDDYVRFEHQHIRPLEFDDTGKVYLGGTVDEEYLQEDMLIDNKTAQIASRMYPIDQKYVAQVNIYAYLSGLYERTNNPRLFIRYFYKDWTKANESRDRDYPPCMVEMRAADVWGLEATLEYIHARLLDHLHTPDRICTPEERNFNESPKYALYVGRRDRAYRVYDTRAEAEAALAQLPAVRQAQAEIICRQADRKCRNYCRVRSVCPYALQKGYLD